MKKMLAMYGGSHHEDQQRDVEMHVEAIPHRMKRSSAGGTVFQRLPALARHSEWVVNTCTMETITLTKPQFASGDHVVFFHLISPCQWTVVRSCFNEDFGNRYDIRKGNITLYDVEESLLTLSKNEAA